MYELRMTGPRSCKEIIAINEPGPLDRLSVEEIGGKFCVVRHLIGAAPLVLEEDSLEREAEKHLYDLWRFMSRGMNKFDTND